MKARLMKAFGVVMLLSLFLPGISQVALAADDHVVVIYGCGMSGVASAIQAGRMGVHVKVVEPTDWCGGQATAAGEGNMDTSFYFWSNPPPRP